MSFSEAGVPTGGYHSYEASVAILELLKTDIELSEESVVSFALTDRPAPQRTVSSQIIKEVDELRMMPDGADKEEKEKKIIEKIDAKLRLAQRIADKLRPESFSVGVGFPFGIQVSFSWSSTKKESTS